MTGGRTHRARKSHLDELTRLAARLVGQAQRLDAHAAIHRTAHVVDRERRHRGRGHRLHLNPGLPRGLHGGRDLHRILIGLESVRVTLR